MAGFMSKHSCETQVISFSQEVHGNLKQGQKTDNIFMDFSEASNKVDHHKPILKIQGLGVDSEVISWGMSFLYDRTQQVDVDGQNSFNLRLIRSLKGRSWDLASSSHISICQ